MARKIKKRTPYQRQKKETDKWCSRYIRLRDTQYFEFGFCYTCGNPVTAKEGQACHFKSRGVGGHSGIYFDERAIHLGCVQCNAFEQGRPEEYEQHLIEDYGPEVVKALKLKHKTNKYTLKDLIGLELYFRSEVERMLKEYGVQKWW